MDRAADVDAFRRSFAGSWLSGAGWLHFCAHDGLFGVVLHGRPAGSEVSALVASLLVELEPHVPPHGSLVDASRLEGVDAGAFDTLHRYVREHHRRLSVQVTRLALVRPAGMEGAVVVGFYGVLEPPYPVEVFDEPQAALAWLGEKPAVLESIGRALELATGDDPLRVALRAKLREDAASPPRAVARALGVSERTLQRRLAALGTTYSREVVLARLLAAKRRMIDTDEPLTAIALDVGFRSPSHFSRAFRREEGQSPTEWRRAQRQPRG